MGEEKDSCRSLKKKTNIRIIDCFLVLVVVLNLLILMVAIDVLNRTIDFSSMWDNIIVVALVLLSVGSVFLVLMLRSLSRSIGGIKRINGILNKFINGDYSLRISVRKKDYLRDITSTLNKLLAICETNKKSE